MADQVNLKVKQSIKGNTVTKGSSICSRFKMRLILPADVVINVKTRTRKSPVFKKTQQTKSTVTNSDTTKNEVKSNDK